jgi:hypothetical protein
VAGRHCLNRALHGTHDLADRFGCFGLTELLNRVPWPVATHFPGAQIQEMIGHQPANRWACCEARRKPAVHHARRERVDVGAGELRALLDRSHETRCGSDSSAVERVDGAETSTRVKVQTGDRRCVDQAAEAAAQAIEIILQVVERTALAGGTQLDRPVHEAALLRGGVPQDPADPRPRAILKIVYGQAGVGRDAPLAPPS